jgi:hypothetical protein
LSCCTNGFVMIGGCFLIRFRPFNGL